MSGVCSSLPPASEQHSCMRFIYMQHVGNAHDDCCRSEAMKQPARPVPGHRADSGALITAGAPQPAYLRRNAATTKKEEEKKTPSRRSSHLWVDAGRVRVGNGLQDLLYQVAAHLYHLLRLRVLNKCASPRQRRAAAQRGHVAGTDEDCCGRRNRNVTAEASKQSALYIQHQVCRSVCVCAMWGAGGGGRGQQEEQKPSSLSLSLCLLSSSSVPAAALGTSVSPQAK